MLSIDKLEYCIISFETNKTYLSIPPPFACVHFVVHPLVHRLISKMLLGLEDQVCGKVWVAKKRANALQSITIVDLKCLTAGSDLLASETGATVREMGVNNLVELPAVLEGKTKIVDNLSRECE